ncbi:hypothetical protein EJ05DRAFT_525329 [Pseudovirgaria hyperparasitica]|uniref:Uncharacterized protein n=1 Tax=Pseudovirgaria hyperparasitica TaxID=470096 RepID=A0A6A6WCD5_9PEZI|nr:uncharacterized protein EJ05DRAFT_525329 [Pseudovirgaria hyperparasitica]KAF2760235.1 hypothetical protein EJ05DRAFT_525329 [Pseudovirgaria hyperparasitica]
MSDSTPTKKSSTTSFFTNASSEFTATPLKTQPSSRPTKKHPSNPSISTDSSSNWDGERFSLHAPDGGPPQHPPTSQPPLPQTHTTETILTPCSSSLPKTTTMCPNTRKPPIFCCPALTLHRSDPDTTLNKPLLSPDASSFLAHAGAHLVPDRVPRSTGLIIQRNAHSVKPLLASESKRRPVESPGAPQRFVKEAVGAAAGRWVEVTQVEWAGLGMEMLGTTAEVQCEAHQEAWELTVFGRPGEEEGVGGVGVSSRSSSEESSEIDPDEVVDTSYLTRRPVGGIHSYDRRNCYI